MTSRHIKLFLLFFILGSLDVLAQTADEIRYFDAQNKETTKDSAHTIKSYFYAFDSQNEGKIITTTANGRLISDIDYLDIKKGELHGVSLSYDTLGRLQAKEIYHKGKKNGPMESYYPNGQRRRYDLYEDDELISGRCFTATGEDTTYFVYREMPEFPGGDQKLLEFMAKNTKYPPLARENNKQGIVIITFKITSTGTMEQLEVLRTVDESLGQEALRVVEMMAQKVRWKPGILEGEKVDVQYNLPFRFSLR